MTDNELNRAVNRLRARIFGMIWRRKLQDYWLTMVFGDSEHFSRS